MGQISAFCPLACQLMDRLSPRLTVVVGVTRKKRICGPAVGVGVGMRVAVAAGEAVEVSVGGASVGTGLAVGGSDVGMVDGAGLGWGIVGAAVVAGAAIVAGTVARAAGSPVEVSATVGARVGAMADGPHPASSRVRSEATSGSRRSLEWCIGYPFTASS